MDFCAARVLGGPEDRGEGLRDEGGEGERGPARGPARAPHAVRLRAVAADVQLGNPNDCSELEGSELEMQLRSHCSELDLFKLHIHISTTMTLFEAV